MPPHKGNPDQAALAALTEYDVGELRALAPLLAGRPLARVVSTTCGAYVLKPAYRAADVELEAAVASLLAARGFRQPRVITTSAGGAVTQSGYVLREYLPGATPRVPSRPQVTAAMRHVAAVHVEPVPLPIGYQPDHSSLWSRVARTDFLVTELPALLARYGLAGDRTAVAVSYLDGSRAGLAALPRQLVHGDIGPDNVVMAGTTVVALIDFTPHLEPFLFAAATALYWYHVHGRRRLTAAPLRASLAAMADVRPWDAAEIALWPAALMREALRRLATPLELAREQGSQPGPAIAPRLAAAHAMARAIPRLDPAWRSARAIPRSRAPA